MVKSTQIINGKENTIVKLSSCYKVKGAELIKECFAIEGDSIFINADADNYQKIFKALALLIPEPCFFILEVPCDELKEQELRKTNYDPFHKDIYYLDGIGHQVVESFLTDLDDILINDGLSTFGFSALEDQIEIMKGKYNLITVYAKNKDPFIEKLNELGVEQVKKIITVSDILSESNPGYSEKFEGKNGRNIYSLLKMLKEVGLYLDHTDDN